MISMNIISQMLMRELTNTQQAIQKLKTNKQELLQVYTDVKISIRSSQQIARGMN